MIAQDTQTFHGLFQPDAESLDLTSLASSWIDGERCADGIAEFDHVSPATRESIGFVQEAGATLVDQAVGSARRAFDAGWGRMAAKDRKIVLRRFAEAIDAHREPLAKLETLEVGRPISDALGLLQRAAGVVDEHAALIDHAQGRLAGVDDRRMAMSWQMPRGVIAAITPWNVPVMNVLVRLAPALAAGNCVVIKPSEYSPRSAVLIAQLAEGAGLPSGVVNVLTGGGVTGEALARHADVDLITFTGSTATGGKILAAAASQSLKPALLECGGKSPQILIDDIFADPGIWGPIFFSAFWNSGQWCVARTRLLVPEHRVDEALDGLRKAAAGWTVGDPRLAQTRLGPLANAAQFARVRSFFEATKEGVDLGCDRTGIVEGGYHVVPHAAVVRGPDDPLAHDEIFGPLLAIQPYHEVENALRIANATRYGLAASVWTNRSDVGFRLARHLDAGLIDIISGSSAPGDPVPGRHFEPSRQSGFGVDGGLAGLQAYTRPKAVTFRH